MCTVQCPDNESFATDFSPKWPGLNMPMVRDVLNCHRAFIFGTFNCREYTLRQFGDDIERAEQRVFGKAIITPHITENGQVTDDLVRSRATLFPSWLIKDDLFQVMAYHFAVSQWVDGLSAERVGAGLDVFCCVIPEHVVSLYDATVRYEHSIGDDVEQWMATKSVEVTGRSAFERGRGLIRDCSSC